MPQPDYKRMYATLCGALSQALDILKPTGENARVIFLLETALHKAEEQYIRETADLPGETDWVPRKGEILFFPQRPEPDAPGDTDPDNPEDPE